MNKTFRPIGEFESVTQFIRYELLKGTKRKEIMKQLEANGLTPREAIQAMGDVRRRARKEGTVL
jgi:hypothetical protein